VETRRLAQAATAAVAAKAEKPAEASLSALDWALLVQMPMLG